MIASTILRAAEDALIARFLKGGPGSGFFAPAHQGRPGQQGGSRSAGAGAAGGPPAQEPRGTVHRAGITSARPGKTEAKVKKEMAAFQADLEKVASDVSVSMGVGGWEGGSEPTWVTEFRDGPEALGVIAKHARQYEQDGALVMKAARKGDPGAAPQQSLSFGQPLDRPAQEMIEAQLVANGIGGWTWANRGGKTSLIVQTVAEWGGNAENDLSAIQGLRQALNGLGANVTYAQDWTTVTTMFPGSYSTYIAMGQQAAREQGQPRSDHPLF